MKKYILLLAVSIGCFAKPLAQNKPLTTESISVFKNGQAFYLKSGTLKSTNGKFLLPDPAPQALYGTLWFNSPDGSLTRVASYPDTLREQKTEAAVAVWDLLRNNIGKMATGFVDDKNAVSGKVISVSPSHKDGKGAPQYSPASLVTLQSQQGSWTTIPAGQIRYVTFQEQPVLDVSMPKVTPRNLIELSFNPKKAEQPIDMMYLANGLNWAPEYLLELNGETAGTITLQGEVANDAEDITNTNLNLVVGVPNFMFANRPSYLVDFLHFILPQRYSDQYQNTLSNAQYATRFDPETYEEQIELVEGQPDGSRNEDLFFYTLKNFSLPRGGRSMQSIFKEKVEVAHIYECNLPSNERTQTYEHDYLFSPQSNKVFHTLKLENKTKQPWTTASILVMNNQGTKGTSERRPISQDRLTYTPVGDKTYVKLTEAVEVRVEQAEREIDRQKAAISERRLGSFDLVQVEGKIKVKNFKDKTLDLRLKRDIVGNLKKSSVEWQKVEVVNPNNPRNRKTNVCWETPIKANGEMEITYTYEIYVPSY